MVSPLLSRRKKEALKKYRSVSHASNVSYQRGKYINYMNVQVKQVIGALNLALDIPLLVEITQTIQYLQNQRLGNVMSELQIIAVAALVSQNKRLLAVDNYTLVSVGLSLQNFLSRVSMQKKESFLRFVELFSKKWHLCSNLVKEKISYLQRAYFFYLNYHRAFIEIAVSMRNELSPKVAQSVSNIFWLAYMQRGRGVKILGEQSEELKKLKEYLYWIFVDYFRATDSAVMAKILDIQENRIQLASLQELNSQVVGNLQKICLSSNLKTDTLNSQILVNNTAQLLLYDYAKNFARNYQSRDMFQIKFTLFFSFNSTFSPKPKPRFIQNQQVTVHLISQRLQFSDEEEFQEDDVQWRLSEEVTPSEKDSKQEQEEVVLPYPFKVGILQ